MVRIGESKANLTQPTGSPGLMFIQASFPAFILPRIISCRSFRSYGFNVSPQGDVSSSEPTVGAHHYARMIQ